VTGLRRAALLCALLLVGVILPAAAADAESAAHARRAAADAAAQVHALQPRVERALRAYHESLRALSESVSRSVAADEEAEAAAAVAQQRQQVVDNRVRALYMTGSPMELYASVFQATSTADVVRRVAYVKRMVEAGTAVAADTATEQARHLEKARRLAASARQQVVTARDVTRRFDELQAVLQQADAELSRLDDRARTLEEAERAAAELAALRAAAASSAAGLVAGAHASAIPADYLRLYKKAAPTCPGLSWTVLAAIGQVESGHGHNTSTSYAGAQGPMQFLASTFATYAVDGDHDGVTDIQDPADSIYTAAHYLCANGAGHGGQSLYRAIWHYNHADWYVQLVLRIAGQLAANSH
jgi:membrane-bound lytic murein transglycosylase B